MVNGGASQTVDPIVVSTVGAGADNLDAIAADLVIMEVYPPSGNTKTNLASLLTGAGGITHEGIAAAALAADTEATPPVLAEA